MRNPILILKALFRVSTRDLSSAVIIYFLLTSTAMGNDPSSDILRLMNVGKAQLENGEYMQASDTFSKVLNLEPANSIAMRNLARSYYFGNESDQALEWLERARENGSKPATIAYLTGLIYLQRSDFETALPYLEAAVRLGPHIAAARYQLAKTFKNLKRYSEALEQLRETVRLDPQHTGAHFDLAMLARNERDMLGYRNKLRTYIRLRDMFGDPITSPLLLEACYHTRAEAMTKVNPGQSFPQPLAVRFVDATSSAFARDAARDGASLAVLEMDESGRYTFFVLDAGGVASLLNVTEEGVFKRSRLNLKLEPVGDFPKIRVGHFHDAVVIKEKLKGELTHYSDIFIVGELGARLIERKNRTTYVDVTEKAQLTEVRGSDAAWVDYEYDGDIDLLVAGESGIHLWQNGGDGRFVQVAAEVGISLGEPGTSIQAVDLDKNGGVDIIAARGSSETLVYENQRAGRFQLMPNPPGPWPAAAQVLVNDLDNDGNADVILIGEERAVLIYGKKSDRKVIEYPEIHCKGAALIDFDNDGWLDLCLVGSKRENPEKGVIRLWRNGGEGPWSGVDENTQLKYFDLPPVREIVVADYDNDGDSDLLLVSEQAQLIVVRNEGGNAHGQLKLNLSSHVMQNHGGTGSSIELRDGARVVSRTVQKDLPLEIGYGSSKQLDFVQVVWNDGTVDNLLELEPGQAIASVERGDAIITGSCPYLYTWDGNGYQFVTDFLGSGALGLAVTRDSAWPPDPFEFVRVGDEDEFQPLDDQYAIVITSELREVDYLDLVKLVAVDHPLEEEVHPTDSFMPPPVTRSALWAASGKIPLLQAIDGSSVDVTDHLQHIDNQFAMPGKVLPPPLRGVCQANTYTLDFGEIPENRNLLLAVTGCLEFGTASSNIALSQNGSATLIWPILEAETSDGQWQQVPVNIGIPDGRTKTTVCDLSGKLPEDVLRLRLTTSFQIYWDRIALLERQELPQSHIHEAAFSQANLRWRGFSRMRPAHNGFLRVPLFDEVVDQPLWHTTVEGWCTRYGDVLDLITAPDEKMVVLNGGDAMYLSCSVDAFPPIPSGHRRTFFIRTAGWNKEENANTFNGDVVGPLPSYEKKPYEEYLNIEDDWIRRYNTRWVPRNRFEPKEEGVALLATMSSTEK